jgi:hypothetical protein
MKKRSGSIGFHFEDYILVLSMYETPGFVILFVKTKAMALREKKRN